MTITSDQLRAWLLHLNASDEDYLGLYDVNDALTAAVGPGAIGALQRLPPNPLPSGLTMEKEWDFLEEELIRIERHTEAAILTAPFDRASLADEATLDYAIRSWMTKQFGRLSLHAEFELAALFASLQAEIVRSLPAIDPEPPTLTIRLQLGS